MKVLFVHENTLGHGSYLPRFVNCFTARKELGIKAELLNATPLPPELAKKADYTVRGLRRVGLDNRFARWRNIVSQHVRSKVERRIGSCDAVVVNTQSVGLDLVGLKKPLLVALDATFRQLSAGRWFSDPPLGRIGTKLISKLIEREGQLFAAATKLLPWSENAKASLIKDYGIDEARVFQLPPSVEVPSGADLPRSARRTTSDVPRALFVGGDFERKGGDVLLNCYRKYFHGRIELDIVTNSAVDSEEGVRVWKNVVAGSNDWRMLWSTADFFVFPSRLETFGIVLVEALAFCVPIIASTAGATEEILDGGRAGILLEKVSMKSVAGAIENVLSDSAGAARRADFGRQRAGERYNLATNSEKLARLLR